MSKPSSFRQMCSLVLPVYTPHIRVFVKVCVRSRISPLISVYLLLYPTTGASVAGECGAVRTDENIASLREGDVCSAKHMKQMWWKT